jgi:mono/diheme cytochrome c family protein
MRPRDYQSDMSVFDTLLSDKEIQAVLTYIRLSWPQEIRHKQLELRLGARSGTASNAK